MLDHPAGPVVSPKSRETQSAFWCGARTMNALAVDAVDRWDGKSTAELKSKLRDLIKINVPEFYGGGRSEP